MQERKSLREVKASLKSTHADRAYELWSIEEDQLLISLHTEKGLTPLEIAEELHRTLGGIQRRLKLHVQNKVVQRTLDLDFITYIRDGINPVTGEDLSADSAWLHPSILEDLEVFSRGQFKLPKVSETTDKFKSPTSSDTPKSDRDPEIFLLITICKNLRNFVPKISDRDYDLMNALYCSNRKRVRTLQDVGEEFKLSRERVRQIRNKTLRKIRARLKLLSSSTVDDNMTKKPIMSNKQAIQYVSYILDLCIDKGVTNSSTQDIHNAKFIGDRISSVTEVHDSKNDITPQLPTDEQSQTKSLSEDYFRFERCITITPENLNHRFWKDFDKVDLEKEREHNFDRQRLLNSGFPITKEEIVEVIRLFQHGWTIHDLEYFFQRSHKSIAAILEKNYYDNAE